MQAPWHVPCGGVCYGDGNLVFVANDWHTALVPVYLQAYYRDNGYMDFARSVLVIHNMAHQVEYIPSLHSNLIIIRQLLYIKGRGTTELISVCRIPAASFVRSSVYALRLT